MGNLNIIEDIDLISQFSTEEDENDEDDEDDNSNLFEDYSPPNFESDTQTGPNPINNSSFLWILLWIMSFQMRFNLSEVATESLIKFLKLLLTEIGGSEYDTFPNSTYMMKKELGLEDNF